MYLSAISKLSSNLLLITQCTLKIKEYELYFESFQKYIEMLDTEIEKKKKWTNDLNMVEKHEIEFRNVYFRYSDEQEFVLKNICFKIKQGNHVGLVGSNGSGKTTIIKLLVRLYDPTKGMILLNGIDIKNFNKEEYFKKIAVVFQDYKLFPITLKENIILNKNMIDSKLNYITKLCGIDGFIKKGAKGSDTLIFREFDESGIEPSGGESQRICLGRAIYKDADILILDEPTAALDPKSEYEIFKLFAEAINNKTAILVSHRLGMTKLCDTIIVLHDGEIIELGTHDELMSNHGLYEEMYEKQASYYV